MVLQVNYCFDTASILFVDIGIKERKQCLWITTLVSLLQFVILLKHIHAYALNFKFNIMSQFSKQKPWRVSQCIMDWPCIWCLLMKRNPPFNISYWQIYVPPQATTCTLTHLVAPLVLKREMNLFCTAKNWVLAEGIQ